MSVELSTEGHGDPGRSRIAANLSAATAHHRPFDYWLLDGVLPLPTIEAPGERPILSLEKSG